MAMSPWPWAREGEYSCVEIQRKHHSLIFRDGLIAVESTIGSRLTALKVGAVTPCVGAPCYRHAAWVKNSCNVASFVIPVQQISPYAGHFIVLLGDVPHTPWHKLRVCVRCPGMFSNSLDEWVSYRIAEDLLSLLLCCMIPGHSTLKLWHWVLTHSTLAKNLEWNFTQRKINKDNIRNLYYTRDSRVGNRINYDMLHIQNNGIHTA